MPPVKKTPASSKASNLQPSKHADPVKVDVAGDDRTLFRNRLKTPGYLSQFDVARIRKIIEEATDSEFEEYLYCDKGGAIRILGFWEIAQVELWDAEILKRFFHEWIYVDRELVDARIQAAIHAGRLPERFTAKVGLQWIESENLLIGMMGQWVSANVRRRKDPGRKTGLIGPSADASLPPANAQLKRHLGALWSLEERTRLLSDYDALPGLSETARLRLLAEKWGMKFSNTKKQLYASRAVVLKSAQGARSARVFNIW